MQTSVGDWCQNVIPFARGRRRSEATHATAGCGATRKPQRADPLANAGAHRLARRVGQIAARGGPRRLPRRGAEQRAPAALVPLQCGLDRTRYIGECPGEQPDGAPARYSLGFHKPPLVTVYHLHLHVICPIPAKNWFYRLIFPTETYGWLYVRPEGVLAKLGGEESSRL